MTGHFPPRCREGSVTPVNRLGWVGSGYPLYMMLLRAVGTAEAIIVVFRLYADLGVRVVIFVSLRRAPRLVSPGLQPLFARPPQDTETSDSKASTGI
jgi:hypothetical protein